MAEIRIGLIMHGVTGRMGKNQHLIRSIMAIREHGGVELSNGDRAMPDPILVGRNKDKVKNLAKENHIDRWTDDLDTALENQEDKIFFDAGLTQMRSNLLKKAMDSGKHIYCEKPVSENLKEAVELVRYAKSLDLKNGVVHDKLSLPGLIKLKMLRDSGFFGKILSVRGEFGYWVFEGDWQASQRPSWNYRKIDGGGIILDMLCHWRYVLDYTIAPIQSLSCIGITHIPLRTDENGNEYSADADDASFSTFQLEGGIIAQMNSSWCTRVRRDDLLTLHVDGTHGSAVSGLHSCKTQSRVNTPKPVWNPDQPQELNFFQDWVEVPDNRIFENGFKMQWENFIRHVIEDAPWKYDLLSGAKGVQLAELGLQSWSERRWLDVPEIEI